MLGVGFVLVITPAAFAEALKPAVDGSGQQGEAQELEWTSESGVADDPAPEVELADIATVEVGDDSAASDTDAADADATDVDPPTKDNFVVANGTASNIGSVGLLLSQKANNQAELCTTTMLCSSDGGTVFLAAHHCIRDRIEGGWTRVVMRQTVQRTDVHDPAVYYSISATDAFMLGKARSNGEVIDDGILLLKSNSPTDMPGGPTPLAQRAPNAIAPYSADDRGRYGTIVGYGSSEGWPARQTRGYIRLDRLYRTPAGIAPAVDSSETGWLPSNASGNASDPKNYSIPGDSGGPVFADGLVYGVTFKGSTEETYTFNVSSRTTPDATEAILNRIREKANGLVPNCFPAQPNNVAPEASPAPMTTGETVAVVPSSESTPIAVSASGDEVSLPLDDPSPDAPLAAEPVIESSQECCQAGLL